MSSYHPLVRSLSRTLRERCGVAEGDAVLLAVSGGADSTALLRACALLAPKRGWKLRLGVAHVQHGVRREAQAEARSVEATAERLRLPFFRVDLEPSTFKGRNLEEAMREARYDALARIARDNGFGFLATAHHADDQLETLLLRLCRGCRPEAMAGIAWRRELEPGLHLIRPLLDIEHADAMDFLHGLGQAWHEDASNGDEARARAKLRLRVVPALKELHPDAARKATALADAVRESDCGTTSDDPCHDAAPHRLSRDEARGMSSTALRQRLKAMLHGAGISRINSALLAQLAVLCADASGKRRSVDLPDKHRLVVASDALWIER